ncbi:MAG: hypothetical protein LBG96_09950 [Tannerella sp.]|jgi:hypothetical protein|nr:hypothetical protein [Tannerella sp.]
MLDLYIFSGYVPDQTVEQLFRFPLGAPVLTGMETELRGNISSACKTFSSYALGKTICFM